MISMTESEYAEGVDKGIGICLVCCGKQEGVASGEGQLLCDHCGTHQVYSLAVLTDAREIQIVCEKQRRAKTRTEMKAHQLRQEWRRKEIED